MQVAVIGAGAAGLCAARHILATNGRIVPTVFEQSGGVGGTWVYTENTGTDKHGLPIHSSMYKNLKTNLPKEVMAFPDFPFEEGSESFLHHTDVRKYLESYAERFNILEHVKFHTQVSNVDPVIGMGGKSHQWEVTTKCLTTATSKTRVFDSVMVCVGHYSVPQQPSIPGMEAYTGRVMHSHDYRDPEMFAGKTVGILGAAASGMDISLEIATTATKVYLSHNNPPMVSPLPKNMIQVKGIETCTGPNSFSLMDGDSVSCDVLVLCTGYEYTFPFLSPKCDVTVENREVKPLYKHFIHTTHPSLCFIGIPVTIVPFPQFYLQVQLFVNALLGEVKLPTKQQMDQDREDEKRWKVNELGMKEKHFHKMGDLQWRYNKELAELGHIQPVPQVVEDLYNAVHKRRHMSLVDYKKDSFSITSDNSFTGKVFISEKEGFKQI